MEQVRARWRKLDEVGACKSKMEQVGARWNRFQKEGKSWIKIE